MENTQNLPKTAQAAIYLMSQGLKIIPVYGVKDGGGCLCNKADCESIGKHPMVGKWKENYFKTEDSVRQFWQQYPNANYGVITQGLVVIDVDERNGGDASFQNHLSSLSFPNTFIVRTGSHAKSKHIIFKDTFSEFRNIPSLFQGIDVKADGGYIVGAYSKHMSGNFYEVASLGGNDPNNIFIADLPLELRKILLSVKHTKHISSKDEINATLAFGGEVTEGSRNNTLASYAGKLRRNGQEYEAAKRLLIQSNNSFIPPLPEHEVIGVLNSVWRYPVESIIDWGLPNLHYSVRDEDFKDISDDLIPSFFKDFVLKKQKSLGVPASALMVCLLTIISSILGAAFRVKPLKDGEYEETINLWGLIIAPPSSKKTPIFKTYQGVMDRIDEFFSQQRTAFDLDKSKNEARLKTEIKLNKEDAQALMALENELSSLKSKKTPAWGFYTNDATPEALAELFKYNHRGILYFKDELKGLFVLFSKQGYETLRALLNEAWNGAKSFRSARILRGMIEVKSATISVLGAAQPDVIRESFKEELQKGSGGDGLIARFQLCSIYNARDLKEPDITVNLQTESRYVESILMALHECTKNYNLNGVSSFPALYLSENGFKLFCDYQKKIDTVLKSDHPSTAYICHIGKFGRLILGLSAQFHIVESAVNNLPTDRPIDVKWVRLAIKWADFMDEQAKLLYLSISKNNSVKTLISRIKRGDIVDGSSLRSIYRKNWSGLQTREDILTAIENISDSNWVTLVISTPRGGGPRTDIIRLNPQLINWLNLNKKQTEEN